MATILKILNGRPTAAATTDTLAFASLALGGGTAVTSIDTDISGVSGSDDSLASAKAIKAYVDAQIHSTNATTFTCTDNEDENLDCSLVFVDGATGSQGAETDGDLHYNPSTGKVTSTLFSGSGADLTTLNAGNISSGTINSARVPTLNQNTTGSSATCTGLAATATALATTRAINGVNFDGSAPITITAAGSTLSDTVTIGKGGTGATTAAAASAALLNIDMGGDFAIGTQSDDVCTVGGGLTVTGNLTVSGTTTTVSTATVSVEDPLMLLASGNNAGDAVDIGFYGLCDPTGSQDVYTGLFRDANDGGTWKLFELNQAAPTTTVNVGGTGYVLADLDVAVLTATSVAGTLTTASQTAITGVGTIGTGVWQGTAINQTYLVGQSGTNTGDETQSSINGLNITQVGTIATGVWSGTALVAAKVPAITALTDYTAAAFANASSAGAGTIVTTGALNSGSITSGFGNINIGSSNITTSGLLGDGVGTVAVSNLIGMDGLHVFETGEAILQGEPVTIAVTGGSAGKAFAADYTEVSTAAGHYDSIIGFAVANSTGSPDAVDVMCSVGALADKPAASTNFVIGNAVFVGADGALITAATATASAAVIQVGVAKTTTSFIWTGADIWSVNGA